MTDETHAAVETGAAVETAAELLEAARSVRAPGERSQARRMSRILSRPGGFDLLLALTDEVLRIRSPRRAALVLAGLAGEDTSALGPVDRLALTVGAQLAPIAPGVVVPIARRRVRAEMGGVILPSEPEQLERHIQNRRRQGIRLNVNVLGEAILGDNEAARRLKQVKAVLTNPAVDYVSVKVSAVCAQIDVLRFDFEVERISAQLRDLYDIAARYDPPKFVNLDMEEYRDLELTLAVFRKVLDEQPYERLGAGVVLQAYLPDSLAAMEELCAWARARRDRSGGWVKVRIVKGANLAAERVEAEIHGWPQAPFLEKDETDANYKRMLDVVLDPANDGAVRVGVASHNLFEIGWAHARADAAGALGRVEFEMLEGMSPAVAQVAARRFGSLLLYAPVVDERDMESAIAYLVRRLDENTSPQNFLAHQFGLEVGSPAWAREEQRFRQSVVAREGVPVGTRRNQDRSSDPGRLSGALKGFSNEPDTDFTLAANRRWVTSFLEEIGSSGLPDYRPVVGGDVFAGELQAVDGIDPSRPERPAYRWFSADDAAVDEALASAASAQKDWAALPVERRRELLLGAADSLARARGRLLAVMAYDTGKTIREGDPEVSEAIDFAAYYATKIPEGDGFEPHGTVVVASPWNFPLSIPAGGVLASLAAGNAAILKPAPEAVAVAAELAAALWEGGIPRDILQFVPCVDGDTSRRLITDPRVDAVVLTGSWDTARVFLGWRPDLKLHAETSGKNAIVVTATADLDEAVADVVHAAFGHAGQKCSAASLVVVEAAVYDDPRFLRRLADMVSTLRVGRAWDLDTAMGPVIRPPEGPLLSALTNLDPGERWVVEPKKLDEQGYMWSPGVKAGVAPGSMFHMTECFGPVLGVMRARDLHEAIELQNAPAYGLTAGLHALDPLEIEHWRDHVHAGNLYVNRGITGAIVRRQPFGGWKRSVVGPGSKAGGPNYVSSLGTWPVAQGDHVDVGAYAQGCRKAWAEMSEPVDETGLVAESNAFRYRPLERVAVFVGDGADDSIVRLALAAASAVGADDVTVSYGSVPAGGFDKLRVLGRIADDVRLGAYDAGLWVDDTPVAEDPAREVLRWVREQSVTETRHRHGNVTDRRPGLVPVPSQASQRGRG